VWLIPASIIEVLPLAEAFSPSLGDKMKIGAV
jgi:hypothetical protein